ncbi:MAG TPA: hypothetical protein VG324_05585 [Blastocatellia bacterium]|nr:hypothetical protein [Blastocatellia bacterium]
MHIAREEKLAQLERILHGRALHGSDNLKAFLRFVVDKSIENQEGQLKEYVIATEVFGRGSDFDSRVDSVVRVQAGRLRTKLHEYYETEGRDDRLMIVLPKGQYTPVFAYAQKNEERNSYNEAGAADDALAIGVVSNPNEAPGLAPTGHVNGSARDAGVTPPVGVVIEATRVIDPAARRWRIAALVFALTSVSLGALTIFYRARAVEMSETVESRARSENNALDRRDVEPLWGELLRSSEPILVVYSNTLFQGTVEDGMKLFKPLDAPGSSLGSPSIPQSETDQSKEPVTELYTGIGEVMGSYFLGDFFARLGHASRVKRSLLLTWEDLKTENIVVLGSPAENFFLRDLPQKQEFIFKPMPDDNGNKSFGIINANPLPGEQRRYLAKQDGPSRSQISEDYAVVSLLQGLDGKKRMLILAGITTHGTQAAVEYVTKPDYIRDLVRKLNTAPAGGPPKLPGNFQALVRVKVNGGVPVQVSYVTHHRLDQR